MTSNDSLFRNYDNDNNNVENTYKNMLQFQTIEYVLAIPQSLLSSYLYDTLLKLNLMCHARN